MTPLESAYAYCRRLAFGHYENFPVASFLMPPLQRDAVAAVYAFARQADDFADEVGYAPAAKRIRLLNAWQAKLTSPARIPEFIALQDACRRHGIPKPLLRDLISAFKQDCKKSRYQNFNEVRDYARRSADPVGRIVLRIAGKDTPEALAESDAICTALQLANFWQDLASDAQSRDRIYIPQDDMKRFGVKASDLQQPRASAALRLLLRFQVERTESLFAQGEGLPARLGGRLGLEIRLTLLGGRRILQKIRAQGYDTLAARPRLGQADAPWFAFKVLSGGLA